MKKIGLFTLVLLFITAFAILPIPNKGDGGDFNTISGIWWCSSETSCLHEMGHRLDWEEGWNSNNPKFRDAVSSYVAIEIKKVPSQMAENIMIFLIIEAGQGGVTGTTLDIVTYNGSYDYNPFRFTSAELYASIFEWSGGQEQNMPELFREFYDWKRAYNLIEKYVR